MSLAPRVVGDGTVRVSPHGPYRGEARPGGVTVPDMRLTAWDKLRRCSAIQCNVAGDETRRSPLSRQRECQGRDETAEANLIWCLIWYRPVWTRKSTRSSCSYVDVLIAGSIFCNDLHWALPIRGTRTENYSLSRWHVAISESSCSDLKFSEGDICFFFCKLIGMGYIKNNVFPILVLKIS